MVLVMTLLLATPSAFADWLNFTGAETAPNIAEIRVFNDRVEVALEIFIGDEAVFSGQSGQPAAAFVVQADGNQLVPEIVVQEARKRKDRQLPLSGLIDPRTGRPFSSPPEDDRVKFVQLKFPLTQLPRELTFSPPIDDAGSTAATLGMLVFHKTVPVIDFRYLSQPETLKLDWEDPWYTEFTNRNLTRHHKWPQFLYMYVEPREVRLEALVRVRDLLGWLADEGLAMVNLAEGNDSQLKALASEYFAEQVPVHIDGSRAGVSATRAEFLEIGPTGLQVMQAGDSIDTAAALIGISLSYWGDRLPQTVSAGWKFFDARLDRVPTNVIDPAGPFRGIITPEYPVLEWQNFLRTYEEPAVHKVLSDAVGWSVMDDVKLMLLDSVDETLAVNIAGALLSQTRQAYYERVPAELDRVLGELVVAENLVDVRKELNRAFAVPTRGGGVASVEMIEAVTVSDLSPLGDVDGFSALLSWTAEAVGRHWGHEDRRNLQFRALVDIARVDDSWLFANLTIVEAGRVAR
jgi:hypothetical protein